MKPEEILTMNWLVDNVVGEIPQPEKLTEEEIDNLLSGFKRFLKGQIFVTALTRLLLYRELDVENTLVILSSPQYQKEIAKDVIKGFYEFISDHTVFDDSIPSDTSMMS